jgi:hypothetical protein
LKINPAFPPMISKVRVFVHGCNESRKKKIQLKVPKKKKKNKLKLFLSESARRVEDKDS